MLVVQTLHLTERECFRAFLDDAMELDVLTDAGPWHESKDFGPFLSPYC